MSWRDIVLWHEVWWRQWWLLCSTTSLFTWLFHVILFASCQKTISWWSWWLCLSASPFVCFVFWWKTAIESNGLAGSNNCKILDWLIESRAGSRSWSAASSLTDQSTSLHMHDSTGQIGFGQLQKCLDQLLVTSIYTGDKDIYWSCYVRHHIA